MTVPGFFFNGALSSGHFASYLDLAPNFSGTIFGISNTFSGGGTGFIVPLIIGALTQVTYRKKCCIMACLGMVTYSHIPCELESEKHSLSTMYQEKNIVIISNPFTILQGGHTFASWRAIFLLGAAVYAFGGAVYIPFIRAEPQPWNDPAPPPLASREGRSSNDDKKWDDTRSGNADEMEDQF